MPALIAVAAAMLMAVGGAERSTQPAAELTGLGDDQLAGARVITGFEGHHPPPALRRMIAAGQVSGVILFDYNVGGRRSVRVSRAGGRR